MIKKVKLALAGVALLILANIVVATTYYCSLSYPQKVTIGPVPSESAYIDGQYWANSTAIDWGTLLPTNSSSKQLQVVNSGNVQAKVVLTVGNIMAGWTLTWAKNETIINPGDWANGTMTLTIPLDAVNGTYTWGTWVQLISP
jgi:hypothetical protein